MIIPSIPRWAPVAASVAGEVLHGQVAEVAGPIGFTRLSKVSETASSTVSRVPDSILTAAPWRYHP